jgi:23S rRNA pseudouridine1911/1915/1917 synthase
LKGNRVLTGQTFSITTDQAGQTLAGFLRTQLPGQSWSAIRKLIAGRRVCIDGIIWLDAARRLRAGQSVELLARPMPKPNEYESLSIRHLDEHLVVVEKPSGLSTVRHPAERTWPARRKALHPTLEDLVPQLIVAREGHRRKGPLPRLRVVQRLDKETSGLVVFARTVAAERGLGKQFHAHTVLRRYLAVVPGEVRAQRIASQLVRDRGDRRRGSAIVPGVGKEAITHVEVVELLPAYALVACRLETGRTHQIRIHLAELGHPVCGERVYNQKPDGTILPDLSGAPRLALHAAELGFVHPASNQNMRWEMPLPADLRDWLVRLRHAK